MTFNASIPGVRVSTDPLTKTVEDDTVNDSELFDEVLARLANISKVLEREHAWLSPKVTEARAELDDEIKKGHRTEEFDRGWDDLLIKSSHMDTHLTNVLTASEMLTDIGGILKSAFTAERGRKG